MTPSTVTTVEQFQAQIATLQANFMAKLQAAQAANDFVSIQAVSAEFQQQMAALTAQFQGGMAPNPENAPAPTPEDPSSHLYDNPRCKVDLNLTVYDGERNMLLALLADSGFTSVAEDILKKESAFNSRKHLLKRSMRLTRSIAPNLHNLIDLCKERLGLSMDLDIYVYQDNAFNASCYPSGDNRIYVLLTSALLEKFKEDELTFVLGHEIGHTLFNHERYPVRFLLEEGKGHFSPLHALRLYSWHRGCELSCDRIGLLCGRDFEAAGRAFFKLSSGVTGDALAFQLQDYIRQFDDLSNELKNSDVDPEDMYSSHPFSPLRIKALEIFSKSETYRKLINETGGEITEADMEDQVRKFMSLVEPVALQENSDGASKAKDFLFLAGYYVAAANGNVEAAELKALSSILDPITVQQGLAKVQQANPEGVIQELETMAEAINMAMPVVAKLNILRDLAVISSADGTIDETEIQALYKAADLLKIRSEFIDRVVDEMTTPA